jgi:hypothetical protein
MSKAKYSYRIENRRAIHTKDLKDQITEIFIKFRHDIFIEMKKISISRKVFYKLINRLSSRTVESGAILLGPANSNAITHFYFDRGATCNGSSYSPDYKYLNRKMRDEWLPAGLDMKGIAHSHPGNLACLTYGDMSYIRRLMSKNPDMNTFVAPIVLPYQKSIHPMVISRDRMDCVQKGYFELF